MVSELAAHGYNLIVIDDVYSVLKNSSNFTDFSEFLSALYEANMYAGIGLFSTSSLKVNSDSKGAAILDRDTVRRAQQIHALVDSVRRPGQVRSEGGPSGCTRTE